MSGTCYVCDSPDIVDFSPPHSPVCAAHQSAQQHVISMQTNLMECECGWRIIGKYPPAERQRFARSHWLAVCAQVHP